MVFTSEELINLVDELRARGVTYFKVEGAEITMEALPNSEEFEVEHTTGAADDDIMYYST